MSNVLAPFLTGATQHAEHYIAVIVGLRWAKQQAALPVDKEIWTRFARFERGLKQFWHLVPSARPARSRYLGKREIAKICAGDRPNIHAQILVDQRGVGLLGNYIESLRAIGLVGAGQIVVDDAAVTHLLGDPRFEWNGVNPASWEALRKVFAAVDQRSAWPRLGRRLFDANGLTALNDERLRMNSAARTLVAHLGLSWHQLAASRFLLEPQRRIAKATRPTADLEDGLRELFTRLLNGETPKPSRAMVRRLSGWAQQIIDLDVLGTVWAAEPALAKALRRQIDAVGNGRVSAHSVLNWHFEVMSARGTERWIRDVGERSSLKLTSQRNDPNYRLTNFRTLLQETKWRG